MSHKTPELALFELIERARIQHLLDKVVEQVAQERAAEWAAQIPAEWTASVEQRVQQEIDEWQAAGQPPAGDE